MARSPRLLIVIILGSILGACTLPGAATPTPFTFPTPNLTHTAIFAASPTPGQEGTPEPDSSPQATSESDATPGTPESSDDAPMPTSTVRSQAGIPSATISANRERDNGVIISADYFSSAPTIDGNLDEWNGMTAYEANQTVPSGGDNWTGSNDLSATFYVGWDANYLYVAVRRSDDVFVQISYGRYMFRGDDVEIQIDADLSGDFFSGVMSSDDYQIGLSPGNFSTLDPEAYRWYPTYLEGWIYTATVAAKQVGTGYDLEARIPWAALGITPSEGGTYGFALALSDNDQVGKSIWESMVASVGIRTLTDPTTWGTLKLSPTP
ncbi:MAG: sugar-binding protein [Anaerolineales bacterium]